VSAALRVLAADASQGLVTGLAHAATPVEGAFGPADAMLGRLLAGEACDLAILTHAQIAELTASGRVRHEAIADLGAANGIVYSAAIGAGSANPEDARTFLERMVAARAERAAAGFRPPAIRRATRADEAAVREIVFGILGEYSLTPDPGHVDRDLYDLDAHFFAGGGMFDVAEDADGRLVACCGTHMKSAEAAELRKMYVRREARRQGLGQRLLERALAFARAAGCARMELETASVLKEAMAMYEKAGFVRQAHAPEVKRCDRAYAIDLR
jgi:putative acetyltransferase